MLYEIRYIDNNGFNITYITARSDKGAMKEFTKSVGKYRVIGLNLVN